MATEVFSGSRARFKINGQKVAFAGSTSGEETIDYEAVDVLDLLEVREHVPVAYRVNLNCNVFRVVQKSLKQLGIYPLQDNILTSGVMEGAVEDSVTGATVALVQGVKSSARTWDVQARGIVAEQVTFVCIRVKDESEV